MTLHCLIKTSEWDFPFFKVLANNDTGAAKGHQGGVVVPKDLRVYFPGLLAPTSAFNPTIDHRIEAQLFVENTYKGTVSTRYQFQTWGGERSPESRLTDQLVPLRSLAVGGDVLVIERSIDRLDLYRLTLVRQSAPEFEIIAGLAGGRRWGVLTASSIPVSEADLDEARIEVRVLEASTFNLIDESAETTTATAKRVARSIVFRLTVIEQYEGRCAICDEALKTPAGLLEIDAAHVVPRSLKGADDVRNGLALCKRHHWAFDIGLFSVGDDRKVLVPLQVASISQNASLNKFRGHRIREARTSALKVDPGAFQWHRSNLLVAWA